MRMGNTICAALVLAAAAAGAQAGAPAIDPSAEPVEQIEILGERPGPQLWRVTNGEHTLWLLGLLVIAAGASLHARVGLIGGLRLYREWRATQRNPGGASLAEVSTPPLYARFDALRAKYARRDRKLRELRPIFAAGRLFNAAVDRVGLTMENDVHERVVKLARKRDLPIREVEEIQPLIERAQSQWLGYVEAALANSRVSLAVQSLDRILAPGDVLATLRGKGYAVRGPE